MLVVHIGGIDDLHPRCGKYFTIFCPTPYVNSCKTIKRMPELVSLAVVNILQSVWLEFVSVKYFFLQQENPPYTIVKPLCLFNRILR